MYKILTRGVATNGVINWSFYKELGQEYATEDSEKATAKYQELLNNFSRSNLKLIEDIDMDILVNANIEPCDCGGEVDLADILTNATDGSTIVLSANATSDKKLVIDKDITIDGNGHTMKYNGEKLDSDSAFILNSGKNLTIKNVIIETENKAGAIISRGGSLSLSDVTIKDIEADRHNGTGVYATGICTLSISNSTITGNKAVLNEDYEYSGDIWIGAQCTATIDGGSYDKVYINANQSSASNKGKLTINDGTIEDAWLEYYESHGADLTIAGGTINKLHIASKSNIGEEMMTLNKPAAGNYQGGTGSVA